MYVCKYDFMFAVVGTLCTYENFNLLILSYLFAPFKLPHQTKYYKVAVNRQPTSPTSRFISVYVQMYVLRVCNILHRPVAVRRNICEL